MTREPFDVIFNTGMRLDLAEWRIGPRKDAECGQVAMLGLK